MSRPTLRPRPHRSIPAILVALVLLVVAVLTVWTSVQRLAVGTWPSWWSALAPVQGASWGTPTVIAVAAGACLIGLVLLLAAILPGAPSAVPLSGSDDRHELVVTRSGLARLVTGSASRVSGLDGVSTSVGGRQVSVRVTTPSAQTADVQQRVADDVRSRIADLGLRPEPRVTVTARSTAARATEGGAR